ncbi:methyl-accepting chemotaxis protein [Bradyrhizobium sp. LCT2]|uniref:methyl-accepting chemotaxis protein n=1 Tax=Bradyrhizobium sp. LCT2 TaxID=2493093 RepID=UPI001374077D|nr:methyl-accepting chemotaxis protein [Bradyrhizobium sp. LCT2]QHP67907.1 methyl-accepting chemotaxis protein [Bradyrhizobium sp. LCT2]
MSNVVSSICGKSSTRRGIRIGLREQMALLGVCGVLVTGSICATALHYASVVQHGSNASDEVKAHVMSLSQRFLESGLITSEFLRKPTEVLIKKHADQHERQLADLSRVEALVTALPDESPLRQAGALRPIINIYATRFQNVVSAQRNLGFNEDDGFQGKLRNAVHAVEQRLDQVKQPRLTILMLMMRRHEKDFILRGEDKFGDQLTQRETDFESELGQATLAPEAKSQVLELIRAYKASFVSLMVTRETLNDEVDDLGQIYDRIRPVIVKIMAAADAHSEAAETRAEEIRRNLFWVIGFATMLVGLLALLFGRRIAKTVAAMTSAMRQLGEGRFDVVLPALGRKDELGEMAEAVEMFKLRAHERAQAELYARAEQDQTAAVQRRADIARLVGEFEATVGQVIDTVSAASTQLEASARSLTSSADHSRELSLEVASSSEEASANVQQVATSTNEMATTIADLGRRVEEAADMALEAVRKTELSDQRMVSLAAATERIGSVVQLIAAIARQTNLLALNATIEAARAGDRGKGFAVVAQEVKTLATQTAQATVEIGEQIEGIQSATTEAVAAISETGAIIARISDIAMTVVSFIGEQKTTSKSMAFNLQEAATRTTQVAASAGEVTHRAKETEGASMHVLRSAELLSQESSRLKRELDDFLGRVQAA